MQQIQNYMVEDNSRITAQAGVLEGSHVKDMRKGELHITKGKSAAPELPEMWQNDISALNYVILKIPTMTLSVYRNPFYIKLHYPFAVNNS